MEQLVGYSSGEDEEIISSEYTLEEKELQEETVRNYPIELENLYIFSQNFSNQSNMSSCFLYLPWRPSLKTVGTIKNIVNLAFEQVRSEMPQVVENYHWKPIKNGNLDYHISLYPNIKGDKLSLDQFIQNLSSGISMFKINPKLIGHDSDEMQRISNLKALLLKNNDDSGILQHKKYINFGLNPTLSLFKSPTTESLFLACNINTSAYESNDFFNSINNYINENLTLLDLETTSHELSYHISIQMGEPKNLRKLSSDELKKLNLSLQRLDLSKHLKGMNIHINEMIIYLLNQEKKFIHVPLNI